MWCCSRTVELAPWRAGKELADLQQVLEKVVAAFGKHAKATAAKTLTPPAQLLLRAAQQAIATSG